MDFISQIIDIGGGKEAEQEIQKLNDELENRVIEQIAQLENENKELEAFSYSALHDLRTRLRAEAGSIKEDSKNTYFIKDNGIGFDMHYYDKLFGPFRRLHSDKEYAGTGIGLATVQKILRKHKGEIRAESELNNGTTFYFTLNSNL